MGFVLVSVSKCLNNTQKRVRRIDHKCGHHWRAFYRSDTGRLRTVVISKSEAIKLKAGLLISTKFRSKKSGFVKCDICGLKQEDLGQKVCLECQQ